MPRKKRQNANVSNSLSDAIFGGPSFFGLPPGVPTTQLDQVTTQFKNNRWYLISNMRQVLSELYVEHGLIQTIVDVPVDDAFRGGVEIQTKQLSPEEIEALKTKVEREDDLGRCVQALKWNRLYGGAGVLTLTDQIPEEPLDVKALGPGEPLEFRAVDMWELFWDKQNTEGYDAEIQEQNYEFYSYYSKKLHKSRVMKLKGVTPPSFIRPRLRGWGVSIIDPIIRSMNQYFKSNQLMFEILDEFKVDVYKIKNLVDTLLTPEGTQQVRQRITIANQEKNYNNAITMDAEDDFIQKELSFSGMAEVMKELRMQIACDLRMPLTKIFGISATGFNSGEDDIENYNAMIESQIREKAKPVVLEVLELRCMNLFGDIPSDLRIDFKPLRILTSEQEENVKGQKFNRLFQAVSAGLMGVDEFKNACNKENLLEVQLDVSLEQLSFQTTSEGANEEDKSAIRPLAKVEKPKGSVSTLTAKEAKA